MPLAAESEARVRPRIGRYTVVGRIGKGGMGMVYRALDASLDREVALKTLTLEGALDEESRKRFQIEARAAARLQHPNIITVYELGEDRGVPFIAMELLPGVDLEALLRSREPLPLAEKLDVVIQVLRGLAYAHEHGIVHRDVKPSNIRLLDDGTVRIMDFGIAKLGETGVTRTGMMVGTVYYMSPEQIRGQKLDGRSDVFSVGVILHQMLAGERPFAGPSSTEVLYKIVNEPAPPLTGNLGPVGPDLQAAVERALAKNPEDRFSSASQMAEVLSGILSGCAVPPDPGEAQAVKRARGLIKQGRPDEARRALEEAASHRGGSVELSRALRTARREILRHERPPEPEPLDYPELAATFQAPPTARQSEIEVPPTAVVGETASLAPRRASPWLLAAAGLGLGAALVAGILLIKGTPRPAASVRPAVTVQAPAGGPVEAAPARLPVRSDPSGAAVLLDGEPTGVVTDGELEISPRDRRSRLTLTFRKPGFRDVSRRVTLPLTPGEAVSVTLQAAPRPVQLVTDPPGASVSADGASIEGVTPLDVTLEPGQAHVLVFTREGYRRAERRTRAGELGSRIEVRLAAEAPPGSVRIASAYPLDVIWQGRVLAKGASSPEVSLPGGRQLVTLVADAYFLRSTVTVDVKSGERLGIAAPGVGKINIRAMPDNCEVLIDGRFVDYPPILGKDIAAGTHTVSFRWTDGAKSSTETEVSSGGIAYVTGRKP